MIVQISLSGNLFVFRKKSVSPAFAEKCFYHLLLVSFIVQKKFSWKISFDKIVFLKKNKTSFISSWFLLHLYFEQKLFSIFQCPFIFQLSCYLFFLLFLIVFFLCLFFQTKNGIKKSFEKHIDFFQHFLLNLFLEEGTYFDPKKNVFKKYHSDFFFSKKKNSLKRKIFQDSHALRIACANEGPLDHCCVSWRSRVSQVCVHSVVIDPGRGTSVASSHLSPFFLLFFFSLESLIVKKMFC